LNFKTCSFLTDKPIMTDALQLLQKIADNTEQNDSITIAIVAGASGVLGAGLTAWCSYLITKKTQTTEESGRFS